MFQFGLPDSNDNGLEEENKFTSISNQDRNESRRRINEHHPDSVNISPSGIGRAAFTIYIHIYIYIYIYILYFVKLLCGMIYDILRNDLRYSHF